MAVSVFCRVRPRVPRADADFGFDALAIEPSASSVVPLDALGRGAAAYTFDHVFGPDATQSEVYDHVGRPMVVAALAGINATILTYGQTGSGKTHTMQGGGPHDPGLTPRVVKAVFDGIEDSADTFEFTVAVQAIELYLEVSMSAGYDGCQKVQEAARLALCCYGVDTSVR